MLSRLVVAVVYGVVATLVCILLGLILASLKVSIAVTIGDFLTTWSYVIGVLVALLVFFGGGSFSLPTFGSKS